ncbi:MAG: hypothetical protein KBD55_01755 [Candidatus Pacebacteria bacterium]|nr:hypothetical protein [Candidatus Paceibacterota bacterium]
MSNENPFDGKPNTGKARPDQVEIDLIKKIDQEKAAIDLLNLNRSKLEKSLHPDEIRKILVSARGLFNHFIYSKLGQGKKQVFSITFGNMVVTLGLSRLPITYALKKMDEIVLATPGLVKTETGYEVLDPELLYQNFGPGSSEKKILDILAARPDKEFGYLELASSLNVTTASIQGIVGRMEREGKVLVRRERNGGVPVKIIIAPQK